MSIFHIFFEIILQALFPSSKTDNELFSYNKELAIDILPPAPNSPIISAQSIFAYKNDLVKSLIWNIKYKKSAKAIEIGAYALYLRINKIASEIKTQKILLVPIPISHRRKNERGYNQCELLLDKIVEFNDISSKPNNEQTIISYNNLLYRTTHKDRQTLKDRSHRLEDAKNIFGINHESLDRLKTKLDKLNSNFDIAVIIIDDVITTGSTIKEAIITIEKAGLKNVRGLSLAH
jgi:predicted amidophosphoribosyltransferase